MQLLGQQHVIILTQYATDLIPIYMSFESKRSTPDHSSLPQQTER
jgi:hypothetical protein